MACDVMNPDDDYSNKKICIEKNYNKEVKDIKEKFRKKVKREKGKLTTFEERIYKVYEDHSYTNVQDLECKNSVKTIACKKQTAVKVSTRFLSTKLLINAKVSPASFCTPMDKTKKIYNQNKIINKSPYVLTTDTINASLMFIIIADKNCDLGERALREMMLKILLGNDIYEKLDTFNEYFEQVNKRNPHARKQVVLCEFENIDHGIICAITLIPKYITRFMGFCFKQIRSIRGCKKGQKILTLISTLVGFLL